MLRVSPMKTFSFLTGSSARGARAMIGDELLHFNRIHQEDNLHG